MCDTIAPSHYNVCPYFLSFIIQDLLFVIGALGNVVSIMSPGSKDVHAPATLASPVVSHVRIKRLVDICTIRTSLNVDEVSLTLLSPEELTYEEKMHPMLRSYIERVRRRGTYSRAVHTAERLAIQRMRSLGINVAATSSALRGIRSVIDINHNYDTNELILENIEALKRVVVKGSSPVNPDVRHCEPLLSATLSGLHLSHYALTYDSKTSLFLEEVVVVDQDSNPVLHAFCENQGHFDCLSLHSKTKPNTRDKSKHRRHKKHTVDKSTIESMAKQLEATSIASYSAIAIVYVQQDAHCSWGGAATPRLYSMRHTAPNMLASVITNVLCR